MGQRHAFWVIVTGETATAFRSRYREDLLPALTQLQRTQPDAVIKWFERGRLWETPMAARDALKEQRSKTGPPRGRDWRPGGSHQDPRARFQLTRDEKRARFRKRTWGKPRPEDESGPPRPREERQGRDERRDNKPRGPWQGRDERRDNKPRGPWQGRDERRDNKPRGPWQRRDERRDNKPRGPWQRRDERRSNKPGGAGCPPGNRGRRPPGRKKPS